LYAYGVIIFLVELGESKIDIGDYMTEEKSNENSENTT